MNFYKLALWLAAASIFFIALIVFSPTEFMVLKWDNLVFTAGILFIFLLFSWICALIALALNFIYAERLFIMQEKFVPKRKKYLPALLCIPAAMSFCWFCYKFYVGFTSH